MHIAIFMFRVTGTVILGTGAIVAVSEGDTKFAIGFFVVLICFNYILESLQVAQAHQQRITTNELLAQLVKNGEK